MKRPLLAAAIVVGVLAYPSVASAAPTQILIDDNFFAPRTPPARNLAAGASFQWQSAAGSDNPHNVRQNAALFNSGAPTSGTINFSVSASAGSYRYYCTVHATPSSGPMDGVVSVRPTFGPNPIGAPFTVTWALQGTTTGNRFDVQYRIGIGAVWKAWKNDVLARAGFFGQNNQPVQVIPNRTYQFRARSQSSPSLQSGWSPILTVNT